MRLLRRPCCWWCVGSCVCLSVGSVGSVLFGCSLVVVCLSVCLFVCLVSP